MLEHIFLMEDGRCNREDIEKIKNIIDVPGNVSVEEFTSTDFIFSVKFLEKLLDENPNSLAIHISESMFFYAMGFNRKKDLRAISAYDVVSTREARENLDANIFCLNPYMFTFEVYRDMIKTFVNTKCKSYEIGETILALGEFL